jgi:hypothetical protein
VHLANERKHEAEDRSDMKGANEVVNAAFGEKTYTLLAGTRIEPNSETVCKRQTRAPLTTKFLSTLAKGKNDLVGQDDMNYEYDRLSEVKENIRTRSASRKR